MAKKHEKIAAIGHPNENQGRAARPTQTSSPRTEIRLGGPLPARRWRDVGLDHHDISAKLDDLRSKDIAEFDGAGPNSSLWRDLVGELAYLIALLTIGRGRNRRDRILAHMRRILRNAAIAFGSKATLRLIALRLGDDLSQLLPIVRRRGRKSRRFPPGIINRVLFGLPDPRKVTSLAGRIKTDSPTLSDKAALLKALDQIGFNERQPFGIDDLKYYQRRFSEFKKK